MATEQTRPSSLKKDRKLGDEWDDWSGAVETTSHGKRLFCFLLTLSYAMFLLLLLLLFYLTTPRLAQFHPALPSAIGIIGVVIIVLLTVWCFLLVLSLWLQRNLVGPLLPRRGIPESWARFASRLGGYLGYSGDSVGNSFIKLHNAHVRLMSRNSLESTSDLLVLLPRCLDRPTRDKIEELKEELQLVVKTVAGGEAARDAIASLMPRAVIAVACERDLLTGIRDVHSKIPVLGIPNERPEGPCKNTWIDVALLENDIRSLISGRH